MKLIIKKRKEKNKKKEQSLGYILVDYVIDANFSLTSALRVLIHYNTGLLFKTGFPASSSKSLCKLGHMVLTLNHSNQVIHLLITIDYSSEYLLERDNKAQSRPPTRAE